MRLALLLPAVVAALTSCSSGGGAGAAPEVSPPMSREIVPEEVNTAGYRPPSSVVSVVLTNTGSDTAEIVGVVPHSDPELEVHVLGFAGDCDKGCIGSSGYTDRDVKSILARTVQPLPYEFRPTERPWLHLLLRPRPAGGVEALQRRCLRVRSLTLVARDGTRYDVTSPAKLGYVAALQPDVSEAARRADYQRCARSTS